MLNSTILTLPCVMCIIGVLLLLFTKNKQYPQTCEMFMLLTAAGQLFVSAHYMNANAGARTLVYLDISAQYLLPAMCALIVLYLHSLTRKPLDKRITVLIFIPSILIGTAALISYLSIGIDNAAAFIDSYDASEAMPSYFDSPLYKAHAMLTFVSYNRLSTLVTAITAGIVMALLHKNKLTSKELLRFLKGHSISRTNLIGLLLLLILAAYAGRMLLGRKLVVEHTWIPWTFSIIVSILIFCFCYVSILFSTSKISLREIRRPSETKAPLQVSEALQLQENMNAAMAARLEKFQKYFEEEKPYLNPSLSIETVAEALSTNRTYISELIKKAYHTSFRTYINTLRIEEVKKKLLNSPDEKLESIASSCGFASSSQMVKKFCELTGDPPRVWAKKHAHTN